MSEMNFKFDANFAAEMDQADPLKNFRSEFVFPKDFPLYFAGHSLGLMPNKVKKYVNEEFEAWGNLGVEGHFLAKRPWLSFHELLTQLQANLVGALPSEVVTMNTLTVNLHLMMVSFYRPTKDRFKIIIENNTFPSDKYAVDSQARFHGFSPSEAVIELKPSMKSGNQNQLILDEEEILNTIKEHGESLSLVMLGNCNYLSGQYFSIPKIVKAAHAVGAKVGFNLAHGAGNILLNLHDDGPDFAVWCSYKYLNSGPGNLSGAFVHQRHHESDLLRFAGWWGHDKKSRFKMGPEFRPIPGAEGWQLSNPPIFSLSAMLASLEIFEQAGMKNLVKKSQTLTAYLEYLLKNQIGEDRVTIMTPSKNRGSMLCLKFKQNPQELMKKLAEHGCLADFREPDIIRMTPTPMYNSFSDVFSLVKLIRENIF